jgi:hypothetical protein
MEVAVPPGVLGWDIPLAPQCGCMPVYVLYHGVLAALNPNKKLGPPIQQTYLELDIVNLYHLAQLLRNTIQVLACLYHMSNYIKAVLQLSRSWFDAKRIYPIPGNYKMNVLHHCMQQEYMLDLSSLLSLVIGWTLAVSNAGCKSTETGLHAHGHTQSWHGIQGTMSRF